MTATECVKSTWIFPLVCTELSHESIGASLYEGGKTSHHRAGLPGHRNRKIFDQCLSRHGARQGRSESGRALWLARLSCDRLECRIPRCFAHLLCSPGRPTSLGYHQRHQGGHPPAPHAAGYSPPDYNVSQIGPDGPNGVGGIECWG